MPIVPIRPQGPSPAPATRPPDPTFLMMAAAQMHSEGRLVQGPPDIPATVRGGERTEPQPSEPPRRYHPSSGPQDKPSMMT